jgi:hypothetical protein
MRFARTGPCYRVGIGYWSCTDAAGLERGAALAPPLYRRASDLPDGSTTRVKGLGNSLLVYKSELKLKPHDFTHVEPRKDVTGQPSAISRGIAIQFRLIGYCKSLKIVYNKNPLAGVCPPFSRLAGAGRRKPLGPS